MHDNLNLAKQEAKGLQQSNFVVELILNIHIKGVSVCRKHREVTRLNIRWVAYN